jgi:excisionase family DNA binding protein
MVLIGIVVASTDLTARQLTSLADRELSGTRHPGLCGRLAARQGAAIPRRHGPRPRVTGEPPLISKRANRSGHFGEAVKRLERLLTVDQLAELWQVSPRTVRRMIADGRLPVVRLGRAVRIPAKAATP